MENILGVTPQPTYELSELMIPDTEQGKAVPEAAFRNQASITAQLADDSKVGENYKTMMAEGKSGSKFTFDQLKTAIFNKEGATDMRKLLTTLGDPTVDLEMKKQLVAEQAATPKAPKSLEGVLYNRSIDAPSAHETPDAEKARWSLKDSLKEIEEEGIKRQGIVNSHAAAGNSDTLSALGDISAAVFAPFGNSIFTSKIATGMQDSASLYETLKAATMSGSVKMKMIEAYRGMSPVEQTTYIKNLAKVLSEKGGLIFPGSNHYAQVEFMRDFVEEGKYDTFDKWLDNLSPLLDIVGIRMGAKAFSIAAKERGVLAAIKEIVTGAPKAVKPATDVKAVVDVSSPIPPSKKTAVASAVEQYETVQRITLNSLIKTEHPATPLSILNQTNPEKARDALMAIHNDLTDEAAKALAGVTRDEALFAQVVPSILTPSGRVTAKVVDPFKDIPAIETVDEMLKEAAHQGGASGFTTPEIGRITANFTEGLTVNSGLTIQEGMGGFKIAQDGRQFDVSAVYGTSAGAFSNAQQAVDQALLSLRSYGVLPSEITVLERQGMDYVPTTLEAVKDKPGSYLLRLEAKLDFDFNALGATGFDPVKVKRNWLDRISSGGKDGAARYAMDPASMLDPVYTNALGSSVDRAGWLDQLFNGLTGLYTDLIKPMTADRRVAVDNWLKHANDKGIPFDSAMLRGNGFNDKEIEAIHTWKRVWDNHYYFENDDLIKTYNRDGFMKYVGAAGEEYHAKPIAQNADIGKIAVGPNQTVGRVFDPVTGKSVYTSAAETDMLYKAGGTHARLRAPVVIDGEVVSHIIVRNTASEYLRKFRSSDTVLNYRPMHYTRSYKSAWFVDEVTSEGRRAVAVGPDIPSAKSYTERANANAKPGVTYEYRQDDRGLMRGTSDWVSVEQAQGRIAQRHRGQTLGTTDGTSVLGKDTFIVDPTNSAVRAAASLSGRIAMRAPLEQAKARAMAQYGEFFPKDTFGNVRFPTDMSQIGKKGVFGTKEEADARTTVGFIHQLEQGFQNTVDDTFKRIVNQFANSAGERGYGSTERAIRSIQAISPTQNIKTSVFYAYVATSNMFRQLLVQTNNLNRMMFYHPKGIGSLDMPRDIYAYFTSSIGSKADDFANFARESGLLQSIDRTNMIQGSLSDVAEHRNTLLQYGVKAAALPRKVGFDLGESINMVGALSSVYRKAISDGKNVSSKTVRDELYSTVRALTQEMNRAGDMPYNAGWMAPLTQFLQIPHKMLLTYTNRKLDVNTRLRLLAGDALLWGSVGTGISQAFGGDILPDDPDTRYLVTEGVQAYFYNNLFKDVTGEKQDLDLSAFSPIGLDGWAKMFFAITSGTGLNSIFSAAPAYGVWNPENGRIPIAIKELSRYFSGDIETNLPPATLASVANKVAKISSGYSSAAQAHAALEIGKWVSPSGDVLPGEVTPALAIAKGLGFERLAIRDMYQISQQGFKDDKAFREDVLKTYKETKRLLAESMNGSWEEQRITIAATNVFLNKWKSSNAETQNKAWSIINSQMKKDLTGKDTQLMIQMLRRAGVVDTQATPDQIKRANLDPAVESELLRRWHEDVLTNKGSK